MAIALEPGLQVFPGAWLQMHVNHEGEFKNAGSASIIGLYQRTNRIKVELILAIYENDIPFITNYCMHLSYSAHH